jgi:hypothetical protein
MSAYLEKQKLLDFVKQKEEYYLSTGEELDNFVEATGAFARAASYTEIRKVIESDYFDWQPND